MLCIGSDVLFDVGLRIVPYVPFYVSPHIPLKTRYVVSVAVCGTCSKFRLFIDIELRSTQPVPVIGPTTTCVYLLSCYVAHRGGENMALYLGIKTDIKVGLFFVFFRRKKK